MSRNANESIWNAKHRELLTNAKNARVCASCAALKLCLQYSVRSFEWIVVDPFKVSDISAYRGDRAMPSILLTSLVVLTNICRNLTKPHAMKGMTIKINGNTTMDVMIDIIAMKLPTKKSNIVNGRRSSAIPQSAENRLRILPKG
mmetsp:Transcript_34868/g.84351  ORF Transcript_34868/g.84351 Transcript_34868/m.84351 type:complete len:145 (-) Transcript_34868:2734-3168(-)